jgi:hypothetical protein
VKKPIQKQKRRLIAKSASLLHYRKMSLPVLKTSGTTGHLPSPAIISITYGGRPYSVYQFVYQFPIRCRKHWQRQPA